ncbi:LysR family transcriptional regulator [Acetobacter sp. DsW_063]|uniref:LysR family transcriptional regulator n=1 Tax=Acetobacter sp. DsW_063 TaxID=1514894 RepID=UPI000A37A64E|nr:LysR family transcriptional regulator [Acetobacter sp. DsW_063]
MTMKRGLDWRDLQYFHAVARAGSLSVAGRTLGVDHATVGRHIQSLEQAMGVSLFERHLRGYALTRHGERLLASVEAMNREAGRLAENAPAGGLSGTVRISALEGIGNFFLASRIGTLIESNPNLTVEMVTIQQIVTLSRHQADILITLHVPPGERFSATPLTDYRLFVYGSPEYLARNPPIRTTTDLAQHVFAGYVDELLFTRGLDYLEELGVPLKSVRIQNSSLHAQMEAACSGICLAVLPAFIAAERPALVRILPDEAALTRTYWLITRSGEQEAPRIRRICELLRAEVEAARAVFLGE